MGIGRFHGLRWFAALAALTLVAAVGVVAPGAAVGSGPQLINLPYNRALGPEHGTYAPVAFGHDAHSYWIWYDSAIGEGYAVVVAVPDGLPAKFTVALPQRAKPHVDPNDHEPIIIVGPLNAANRAYVRGGLAPETRSAFFQIVASKTDIYGVDTRMMTTSGMTVPVAASTSGSLPERFSYRLRWGPKLKFSHAQPLPLTGELYCLQSDANRELVFFELAGVTGFSLSEDGTTVISNSALARDPLQAATGAYALYMPKSVHAFKVTTQPSSRSFSTTVADCQART